MKIDILLTNRERAKPVTLAKISILAEPSKTVIHGQALVSQQCNIAAIYSHEPHYKSRVLASK